MRTIRNVIDEFTAILENFGDLYCFITEKNEDNRPLTPLDAVCILEAGIQDDDENWENDEYDTICVLSTSKKEDVLDRILGEEV